MTAITLPDSINKACQQLNNEQKQEQAINRFLKTKAFAEAVFNHKKNHPEASVEEYRFTLKVLLSHYKAGQSVNLNDLIDDAHKQLADMKEERTISRNAVRDSFIPLLSDLGIIAGNKPMIWAYLDAPTPTQKLLAITKSWHAARLEKTPAEIQLSQEHRNNAALRKVELVTLENRGIQDDIHHHLDYIAKEDKKCRELAHQLGIPYSKAKEDVMKQRKKAGAGERSQKYGFAAVVGIVLLAGFLINTGKTENPNPTIYQNSRVEQPAADNGFSAQENIWRARYIEIYHLTTMTPHQKEQEMITLSGEYMISMNRMQEIIASIDTEELK